MTSARDVARRRRPPAVAAVAAALLVAALAGCDDDGHLLFPEPGYGTIRGRVWDGAPGQSYPRVRIERISAGTEPTFLSNVTPDSTGRFVATVPNGPVFVSIEAAVSRLYYAAAGLTPEWSLADTLTVAGEVLDVELACGRIALEVELPEALHGDGLLCRLTQRGQFPWMTQSTHVQSGDDGILRHEWRFVGPGEYWLGLEASFGRCYLPAALDTAAAELVTVTAGEVARHASALLAPAVIAGAVTGSWQAFAADIPVVRLLAGDGQSINSTQVAEDGSYELSFLPLAPVTVAVTIGPIVAHLGGVDQATATRYDLAPGERRDGVSRVESGLALTIDGLSAFARYYTIEVFAGDGRLIEDLFSYEAYVPLANLDPGDVFVQIVPDSDAALWLPQFYDRRDSLAQADAIALPAGVAVPVTIALQTGGRIAGRLRDAQGQPTASWFNLTLHAPDDPVGWVASISYWDSNYDRSTGAYRFTRLRDGAYKVRVQSQSGQLVYWPGVADFAEAGLVTVEDLGEVTGIDLTLPP